MGVKEFSSYKITENILRRIKIKKSEHRLKLKLTEEKKNTSRTMIIVYIEQEYILNLSSYPVKDVHHFVPPLEL